LISSSVAIDLEWHHHNNIWLGLMIIIHQMPMNEFLDVPKKMG